MTFYETLKKVLSTKHRVLVKNNDGDYQIFSCEKGSFSNFRCSSWYADEKEAVKYTTISIGDTEEEINEEAKRDNWQIVKAYDLEHEGEFKEGEKVQVIDEKSEYYGYIVEIYYVFDDWYRTKWGGVKNNLMTYSFKLSQISYPFKTEETEELTMEQVCKELGRNIKIKK